MWVQNTFAVSFNTYYKAVCFFAKSGVADRFAGLAAVKCRSLAAFAERMDGAVSRPGAAAGPHRIRAVAEAYVSFAREHPGLFAMACHGGVEAAVALVAERVGGVPYPTALAVWSAAHGVAALSGSEADQKRVLDLVLSGIVP